MSDTVLSGDWTVYYLTETRQKRVVWTGGTNDPTLIKDLYLALQDLFDEPLQMNDGAPMSADTPTEYNIGIIDSGDFDPFFIDPASVEHLYGGSLKTLSWKRVVGSNVGIVRVNVSSNAIVAGDIGNAITHADLDAGVLLAVQDLGSNNAELWIRPDSYAAANNFDSTSGTLTCNTHTGTQTVAATTGDMLWANIYNTGIATLAADTHLYVYQNEQTGDTAPDALVVEYSPSGGADWWNDGTFDILILVADQSSDLTDAATFIDEGYITVMARQYTIAYSFYIVNLSAGGRNPIPLETGNDLNNTTGYAQVTLSTSANNWNVGDEVLGATSGARAIITGMSGSNPTITLQFYYIGVSPFIEFNGSEAINNQDDSGTSASSGSVTTYGPAALAGLSIVHGANNTFDVNSNGTNEYYSVVINVNTEALSDAYEWAKYQTRRGETGVTNHDSIEGEQYIGTDYRIVYSSMTGTVSEGDVVTQLTTGATATVVAIHLTPKIVILRNTRGTFDHLTANQIQKDVSHYLVPTNTASDVVGVTPTKSCPYGLFAGGTWFLAPGVVLNNRAAADANNYQATDDTGTINAEPTSVNVTVTGTRIKDWVSVFRLVTAGGAIKDDEYTVDTLASVGGTSLSVGTGGVITADTPGKSGGGILFVVDNTVEYRYRYSSWSGTTDDFTLFAVAQATCDAGGTTTSLVDISQDFVTAGVKVGDIVRNDTHSEYGYITVVTTTTLTTTLMANAWDTDLYTIGAVVAAHPSTTSDLYVPILHVYETAGTDGVPGSEGVSIVYVSDIPVLVKGRHAGDTSYNIKPFSIETTISNAGLSQGIIRTTETITS